MLQDIVTHPVFQLAGFAVGIFGLLVGYYFYRQTRNRKALRYTHKDISIFDQHHLHLSEISLKYKDEEITQLRRIGVLLWNTGDVTITFADDLNAIGLVLPEGCRILGAYMAAADDIGGRFEIKSKGHIALISFDYLRSRESVLYYIDYAGEHRPSSIEIEERTRHLCRRGRDNIYTQPWVLGFITSLIISLMFPLLAYSSYNNAWTAGAAFAGVLLGAGGGFLYALLSRDFGVAHSLYMVEFHDGGRTSFSLAK